MERVKIVRLGRLPATLFEKIKSSQQEAAQVWNSCRDLHLSARQSGQKWPGKVDLQKATKGLFALHSQTVQMICHSFLANVETTKKLRKNHPGMKMKYPWREKKFYPLVWPQQAVSYHPGRLLLPMGRGRGSLVFKVELPENWGSIRLVWNDGYELHICYGSDHEQPLTKAQTTHQRKACVDLGEIHQAAVVTDTGKALVISGRGIRSLKRGRSKSFGEIQRLKSRCKSGSKRHQKLCRAQSKVGSRAEKQIRDLRHKGTAKVVEFCRKEAVTQVFVGNPDGVRKKDSGRKHNQRMGGWEYGKDIKYIQEKCAKFSMKSFHGSERGTSSHCPSCKRRRKVKGRMWICPRCSFQGHRDVVGGTNMFLLAFGKEVMFPVQITYLRAGLTKRAQRIKTSELAIAPVRSSRADSPLWPSRPLLSHFGLSPSAAHLQVSSETASRTDLR